MLTTLNESVEITG